MLLGFHGAYWFIWDILFCIIIRTQMANKLREAVVYSEFISAKGLDFIFRYP